MTTITTERRRIKEKLDVIEEDIAQYSRELLDILLKDRTTNENIIWATSDYTAHGELYAATEQIYANLITGVYSKLIQPRVAKAHEQKNSRTRDKAEVFTPSWICKSATLKTTWWTSIGLVGLMFLTSRKTAPGRQRNGSCFLRISSTLGSIMWMHGELRFPAVRPLIW